MEKMHTRRVLKVTAFCLALGITSARADLLLTSSFIGTTESGWIIGGNATLTAATGVDTPGNGWLRLKPDQYYQAGYAIYTTPISSDQGIQISFDYNMWGGGYVADGLAVAIIDANHPPVTPGASGGALGYAQNSSVSSPVILFLHRRLNKKN